jgi:lysophospholipase L1-like esterase
MRRPASVRPIGERSVVWRRLTAGAWLLLLCTAALAIAEGVSRVVLWRLGPVVVDTAQFQFSDVWAHGKHPFHTFDRDLLWRPIPGYSEGAVTINSEGFRGPMVSKTKAAGTFRVVVLGDSVTFGYGVSESDTYPRQLERRLRALEHKPAAFAGRPHVEVVNAGVIGYSSWQGRVLYDERIRDYSPDLVVVQFGYNDHHSAESSDRQKYDSRYLRPFASAVEKSAFYQLAARVGNRIWGSRLDHEPVARVSVDEFGLNLLALQRRAAADGARVLFLITPVRSGRPLVENFRPVDFVEHGRPRRLWVRQIDFATRLLGPDYGPEVSRYFLDSTDGIARLTHDPNVCHRVAVLSRRLADFAIFSYLESMCAAARGDAMQAQAAMARSARTDLERQQLESYFVRLRQLAARGALDLLDMAAVWPDDGADLLQDVIHPTVRGHTLLATAIAERLTETDGAMDTKRLMAR